MYVFIIQCILINVNGNKYACTYGKKKNWGKKLMVKRSECQKGKMKR